MEKRRKRAGIIACAVLLSIFVFSFVYSNISFFGAMFSELIKQLFTMFLYAVIPCVPAVILRANFGRRALKGIVLAATVLGGLCCLIHILMPEEIITKQVVTYEDEYTIVMSYVNEWIFILTQYLLTSSVPALYCVAFAGEGRALFVALAPDLMYLLSFYIRYVMVNGALGALELILNESLLLLFLSGIGFAVWALVLIGISFIIYKFVNSVKRKNDFAK